MTKKVVKKVGKISLLILVALMFVVSGLVPALTAFAADYTVVDFDNTNVMDDLTSSSDFNLKEYLPSSPGEHKAGIMNVSEYCYSNVEVERENYGVYVYFYNPDGVEIDTVSNMNKIMLAVSYKTDKNGVRDPSRELT